MEIKKSLSHYLMSKVKYCILKYIISVSNEKLDVVLNIDDIKQFAEYPSYMNMSRENIRKSVLFMGRSFVFKKYVVHENGNIILKLNDEIFEPSAKKH